ncbi:MAG TPA: hypothetical protein PKA88_30260 [Polyangiaceae bacterium]|nr:hypothetical protein [Polyangiaceae bacterium]HMR79686.1 hypothetical protein [Polyangiaceae bacterium]
MAWKGFTVLAVGLLLARASGAAEPEVDQANSDAPAAQGYPAPAYYPVPNYVPVSEPPPWQPGDPAPPGFYVQKKPNWKLVRRGAGMLVGFWAVSVIAAAALNKAEEPAEEDGDDIEKGDWSTLYWPVAGPFLTMKNTSTDEAGWALLLLDGVLQSVGAILVVAGFSDQQEHLKRSASGTRRITVAPLVGQHLRGIGLSATF